MKRRFSYEELQQRLGRLNRQSHEWARTEAALKESGEKYRAVVESSLTGIYIVQDGRFQYVNPRLSEMLDYPSHQDLLGERFETIIHHEDRTRVRSRDALKGKRLNPGTRSTFRALKKNGDIIWVDMRDSHTVYRGRPANVEWGQANLLELNDMQ